MKKEKDKWQITSRVTGNLFVVFSGIALYLALDNFASVQAVLGRFLAILSPFFWAIALAYLMDGGVRYFEKTLFRNRKSRVAATVLTLLISALLLALLVVIVLPQLVQSIRGLIYAIPDYTNQLTALLYSLADRFHVDTELVAGLVGNYASMVSNLTSLATRYLPRLLSYSMAIGSGLISALTAIIASVYMLLSKENLQRQMRKITYALLSPERADRFLSVCHDANKIFGGFITGKMLDSAIIGLLCFVGLSLLRFPYALLISVIVGVTNIIPVFGPFIGAVPGFFILIIVNPLQALEFLGFVLILQQLDGNIIGPRILGESTGLSPMWVLVAIILGQGLFGIPGMVIGVPTFAVIYSLIRSFINEKLAEKGMDSDARPIQDTVPPVTEVHLYKAKK